MRPVGSKYLLDEPLGRGATGTVSRGRQREAAGSEAAVQGEPGELVAIKVLKEELANDADVVMRFLRERSVLLRLTHPNIVRTRDLVTDGLGLVTLLIAATSAMAVLSPDLSDEVGDAAPMLIVLGAVLVGHPAGLARDVDEQVDHGPRWFALASGLKVRVTETAKQVVDEAMQVGGGSGYAASSELSRLYRDVAAGAFNPSTSDSAHGTVATSLLGPISG